MPRKTSSNNLVLWQRAILAGLILITLGWLLFSLRDIFAALCTAFAIAYILNPLVNWLERAGVRRTRSVVLLLFLVLSLGIFFTLVIVPLILREVGGFVALLPDRLHHLYAWFDVTINRHFGYQLPQTSAELVEQLRVYLENNHAAIVRPLGKFIGQTASNIIDVVLLLLKLLLIPMLTIYILVDFRRIREQIRELVPRRWSAKLRDYVQEVDAILAAFFRGQLGLIVVLAIYYSCGFLIVGVPMALFVGTMSGLGHLAPYLGPFTSMVLGLLMLLTAIDSFWQLLGFFAVIGLAQLLESFILTPRLVGKRLGLSPVTTILALLIFGRLLGFLGILLAIPLAAITKVVFSDLVRQYKQSNFYRAGN